MTNGSPAPGNPSPGKSSEALEITRYLGRLEEADLQVTPERLDAGYRQLVADIEPDPPGAWELPAWDDIVHAHCARVYRLAYRLTGDSDDAEDLTEEVFVRVFRSLASYTPGTFEGWLHRITTNLFLDGARSRHIRFQGLDAGLERRFLGVGQAPADALDDRYADGDVQAALLSIPPDYRAAVILCDIEGFSYEEIAETLGVKLGTVRSRIHRGRAQLRAALAHPDQATPSGIGRNEDE